MEREAAHNAPFTSSVLLSAEMVKGMSWHIGRCCTYLPWVECNLTLFQNVRNLSEHEVLVYVTPTYGEVKVKMDRE